MELGGRSRWELGLYTKMVVGALASKLYCSLCFCDDRASACYIIHLDIHIIGIVSVSIFSSEMTTLVYLQVHANPIASALYRSKVKEKLAGGSAVVTLLKFISRYLVLLDVKFLPRSCRNNKKGQRIKVVESAVDGSLESISTYFILSIDVLPSGSKYYV